MKIEYKDKLIKIWHRKPGDVVRRFRNEISNYGEDEDFLLVLKQNHSNTEVYNLSTNKHDLISCSIKCVHYPNAKLVIK